MLAMVGPLGRKVDAVAVSLTRGQLNAVRAAFKAGITPSRIARQFGLSRSDVRNALAIDASSRGTILKSARKAAAPVVVSLPKTPSMGFAIASESEHDCRMIAIAFLFVRVLWG